MPIALIARTCIGKSTPSVLLGAVSLLPSDPSAETDRSARKGHSCGVEARLCPACIPGLDLGKSACLSCAYEQDIARTHRDSLGQFSLFEVFEEHVLAGLEPGNTSEAGHVEQHTAPDQAVIEDVDRPKLRASRGDRSRPAPRRRGVRRRRRGVDVSVAVVVVIDAYKVRGEADRS
jgi:hypothetical protein